MELPSAISTGQQSSRPSPVAQKLIGVVGAEAVLWRPEDRMLYEYDGLSSRRAPDAVVFPTCTEDVVEVVKVSKSENVPVIARGAGTGLSGGAQ